VILAGVYGLLRDRCRLVDEKYAAAVNSGINLLSAFAQIVHLNIYSIFLL
jgi:hypothetical protein